MVPIVATRIPIACVILFLFPSCEEDLPYVEKWPDGTIKEERIYLPQTDREEGRYELKRYDEDGHLIAEGTKVNGKRDREWKEYHPNGRLKFTGTYRVGLKVGLFEEYSNTGAILSSRSFDHNGEPDGKFVVYNRFGELTVKGQLSHGIQVGKWTYITRGENWKKEEITYSSGGKIVFHRIYEDPENAGLSTFIARNNLGNLDSTGSDLFQIKTGYWTYYHPFSFTLKAEGYYENGRKSGPWRYWNADSTLHSEGEYLQDQKVGKWIYVTYQRDEPYSEVYKHQERDSQLVRRSRRMSSVIRHSPKTLEDSSAFMEETIIE